MGGGLPPDTPTCERPVWFQEGDPPRNQTAVDALTRRRFSKVIFAAIGDAKGPGVAFSRGGWRVMPLVLKRVMASRDDDYHVLADGVVVGRLMKAAAPEGKPWMWTLASVHHHEAHTPTHGYEATRATAMAAFAKSWRRGET